MSWYHDGHGMLCWITDQARELLDDAYSVGKRAAESLFATKQRQVNQLLADIHEVNEYLASGRQWLADYMQQQQQAGAAGLSSAPAVSVPVSVSAKLEAATRSVWYRDLMRRAQQQADPADEVQPRLNLEDMDEHALSKSLANLFHITEPEVLLCALLGLTFQICTLLTTRLLCLAIVPIRWCRRW